MPGRSRAKTYAYTSKAILVCLFLGISLVDESTVEEVQTDPQLPSGLQYAYDMPEKHTNKHEADQVCGKLEGQGICL